MEPGAVVVGAGGLLLVGFLVRSVTAAAARGDLPPNPVMGLRTRLSQSSERAWQVAHGAALPWAGRARAAAVVAAVLGLAALPLAATSAVPAATPIALVLVGYVVFVVLVVAAARAGDRAVRADEGEPQA